MYRKTDGLQVDCYVLLFLKVGAKKLQIRIQIGKTLYWFLDFINRKYFTQILKMNLTKTILVNCYSHEDCKQLMEAFLKISQNSQENTCASLFLNKVAVPRAATLFKKRLQHRCFPVNFVNFLTAPFFQATVSQNMKTYIW